MICLIGRFTVSVTLPASLTDKTE